MEIITEKEQPTKIKLDSSGATAVDKGYSWRPIDRFTLLGVKLQLINKAAGVATYGVLTRKNVYWTHWAPLPTF